ncbi:ankyrin [Anaeromyces robustus]|uniref:Ankyrin n=1 Tax=Anaeromyces robustus TaxID=1754192 RepID=A0A1Y1WQW9_9FUNG|nr:ankyrin [Anaeromyces robustus]|eukprot:ORX75921.1 ankyrin [Anaeromyces robustus]
MAFNILDSPEEQEVQVIHQIREDVINDIIHLNSLEKIKNQLNNFEKRYNQLHYDYYVIYKCLKAKLPYNVINLLLSKYKGDKSESVVILRYLLNEKEYELFKLFLKYDFDINGILRPTKKLEFNLFFSEVFAELFNEKNKKESLENYYFLIENGIDLYYNFSNKVLKDTPSVLTVLDIIIKRTYDKNNNLDPFYYKLFSFLINYFYDINVKPIISFIYFGKEQKSISKRNFSEMVTKHIKYIDFDRVNDDVFDFIYIRDASKVISGIIHYLGLEVFFNSEFFKKLSRDIFNVNVEKVLLKQYEIYTRQCERKQKKEQDKILLFNSIENNKINSVKDLLKDHPDLIDIKNDSMQTPLIFATEKSNNKNVKMIRLLINDFKANKDLTDNNKSTALHLACQHNNFKAIPLLISEKIVNAKDKNNNTPLMIAIKEKNYKCAETILSMSNKMYIDVNTIDNEGNSPMIKMIKNKVNNNQLFELLIKNMAYIDFNQFKSHLLQSIINNKGLILSFILNGFYILKNDISFHVKTPLIFSIKENIIDLTIKILNDYPIAVKENDEQNKSCLHYAIENQNEEYFNLLISSKIIDFECTDNSGKNPLFYTLELKKDNMTKKLLYKYIKTYEKADVNIKDIFGNTPFTYMLKHSKIDENVYNILIQHGAFIDYNLFKNERFINNIVNNELFWKLFIDKKIKVKYENIKKDNLIIDPLKFSVELNNYKFFVTLLNHCLKFNDLNINNSDLLVVPSCNNKNDNNSNNNNNNNKVKVKDDTDDEVKENVKNKEKGKIKNKNHINNENKKESNNIFNENYDISVNDKDINNYPALHLSCLKGNNEIIRLLLLNIDKFNIDINEKAGRYQFTPLMLLIYKEDYSNAKLYIENNADVNIRDIYNNTPFIYMLKYSKFNEELYEILIDHDAFIDYDLFLNNNFIEKIIKSKILIEFYKNKKIKIKYQNDKIIGVTKPFNFALKLNNLSFIEILLKNNIDIYDGDENNIALKEIRDIMNNREVKSLLKKYNINQIKISNDENDISIDDNKKKGKVNKEIMKEMNKEKEEVNKREEKEKEKEKEKVNKEKEKVNKEIVKEMNKKKEKVNKGEEKEKEKEKINKEKEKVNKEIMKEMNKEKEKVNKGEEKEKEEDKVNKEKEKEINKEMSIEKEGTNKNNCLINEDYNIDFENDVDINCDYPELHLSCIKGNSEIIKILLNSNVYHINEKAGKYQFTPLMLLIYKKDYNNAKLLIEKNADVNIRDKYNNTPLIYMLKYEIINDEIYELLINNNAFIDNALFYNNDFITKIIDNSSFIQLFIDKKIKIKNNDNSIVRINEPLIYSIKLNNYELVKTLLKNNINIDEKDENNNDPWVYAEKVNNNEIIKLLNQRIEYYDHNLYKENNFSYSFLPMACIEGNKEMIEVLISSNTNDIDERFGEYEFTSLMTLIFNKKYECAKILIENNADVNIKDIYGNTPLTYMLKNSLIDEHIYDLLLKYNAYIDIELFNDKEFISKILYNELFIKFMIDKKIKINDKNKNNIEIIEQPLIFSLERKNIELSKLLINCGANVNEISSKGNTPLLQAIDNNNVDIVKLLIENKTFTYNNRFDITNTYNDINNININGYDYNNVNTNFNNNENTYMNIYNNTLNIINNPLLSSNFYENNFENYNNYNSYYPEIYNVYDIKNDIKNDPNLTSLHTACIIDENNTRNVLIQTNLSSYNKSVDFQSSIYKFTALMFLVFIEDYDNAKYLIKEANPNVNLKDCFDNTPFVYMLRYNKIDNDLYQLLLDHNAYIDKNVFDDKYFIKSISQNNAFIKLFINGKIAIYDNFENMIITVKYPLLFAIKNNYTDLAKVLIKNGANIEETDEYQNTPIFCAIKYENIDIIVLLIRYHVDLTKLNKEGKNILDYSINCNTSVYTMLKDYIIINKEYNRSKLLLSAISNNSSRDAIKAIRNGANVNFEFKNGITPLIFAIYKNNIKMIDLLISFGTKVDNQNINGSTPLKLALKQGNIEIIKTLINQNINNR